jgi:hypothetical protein
VALRVGIPVYDELIEAAHALRVVRHLEQRLAEASAAS